MLANVLQFFSKSVITYGLLIYGTAYKPNLSRIEAVQRRILWASFLKRKFESLEKVFADNKTLTVFELLMVEILKEFFRQLRFESLRILIQPNQENASMFQTRWLKKRTCLPQPKVEFLLIKVVDQLTSKGI